MSQPTPKAESRPEPSAVMNAKPQKEHEWLRKLVGEWTYETDAHAPQPGQPPEKATGTETVRTLGDVWILAEGRGEMPGSGPALSLMTLGYDDQKKRFVGTWIGSMMTHLWVYDSGELDASGKVLTLSSEGPSMTDDGKTARYRDVIALESDDHRTLTGNVQNADGTWQQFMTVDYRRRK
jgi:hypothetical protein